MLRALRLLLVVALLLVAPGAWASRKKDSGYLDYVREKGALRCPDVRVIRSATAAHIGRDPFVDDPKAPRRITVKVRLEKGLLYAYMTLYDAGEEPLELEPAKASTCSELIEHIGLALAIEFTQPPTLSPPPPLPPPPAPAPRRIEPPPAPESASKRSDEGRFHLGFGTAVAINVAPTLTPVIALQAGTRWAIPPLAVSLSFEGRLTLPFEGTTEAGAHVSAMELIGSIVPCLHGWLLFACMPTSMGILHSRDARSVEGDHTGFSPLVALRGGLELPMSSRLTLFLAGDAIIRLRNEVIRLNREDVWRPHGPSVLAQGGLLTFF